MPKKLIRRILSVLLSIVMVLTAIPMSSAHFGTPFSPANAAYPAVPARVSRPNATFPDSYDFLPDHNYYDGTSTNHAPAIMRLITQLDKLLGTDGDLRPVLDAMEPEDDPENHTLRNMLAGIGVDMAAPKINLSTAIDSILNSMFYNDSMVNMIIGMLWPTILDQLEFFLQKSEINDMLNQIDFKGTTKFDVFVAKVGVNSVTVHNVPHLYTLTQGTYNGSLNGTYYGGFEKLDIYPNQLANRINSTQFPVARAQLANSNSTWTNWALTEAWSKTRSPLLYNLTSYETTIRSRLAAFGWTDPDLIDARVEELLESTDDLNLYWGIDDAPASQKAGLFKAALSQSFQGLWEVLRVLLCGQSTKIGGKDFVNIGAQAFVDDIVGVCFFDATYTHRTDLSLNLEMRPNFGYHQILVPILELLMGEDTTGLGQIPYAATMSNESLFPNASALVDAILDPVTYYIKRLSKQPISEILKLIPNLCAALNGGRIIDLFRDLKLSFDIGGDGYIIDWDNFLFHAQVPLSWFYKAKFNYDFDLSDTIVGSNPAEGPLSFLTNFENLFEFMGMNPMDDMGMPEPKYSRIESYGTWLGGSKFGYSNGAALNDSKRMSKANAAVTRREYIRADQQEVMQAMIEWLLGGDILYKTDPPDPEPPGWEPTPLIPGWNVDRNSIQSKHEAVAAISELIIPKAPKYNELKVVYGTPDKSYDQPYRDGVRLSELGYPFPSWWAGLEPNGAGKAELDGEYLLANVDALMDVLWGLVSPGSSFADALVELINNSFVSEETLEGIIMMVQAIAQTMADSTSNFNALIEMAASVGGKPIKLDEIIDHLLNFDPFCEYDLADPNRDYYKKYFNADTWPLRKEFKKGQDAIDSFIGLLTELLAPLDPILDYLLFNTDIDILNVGDGTFLAKAPSYPGGPSTSGYSNSIKPIVEMFTAPLEVAGPTLPPPPASADGVTKMARILDPLKDAYKEILKSPVSALLKLLPNLAYNMTAPLEGGSTPLQMALDSLLQPLYVLLDTVRPLFDLTGVLEEQEIELPAFIRYKPAEDYVAGKPNTIQIDVNALLADLLGDLKIGPVAVDFDLRNFVLGDKVVHPTNGTYLAGGGAAVLFALLDGLGLLELIQGLGMVGITKLIQYDKFPEMERIDYTAAPPPAPHATAPDVPTWWRPSHAEYLVDNADAVLAWAWKEFINEPGVKSELNTLLAPYGIELQNDMLSTVDKLWGSTPYVRENILTLVNLALGLQDTLDTTLLPSALTDITRAAAPPLQPYDPHDDPPDDATDGDPIEPGVLPDPPDRSLVPIGNVTADGEVDAKYRPHLTPITDFTKLLSIYDEEKDTVLNQNPQPVDLAYFFEPLWDLYTADSVYAAETGVAKQQELKDEMIQEAYDKFIASKKSSYLSARANAYKKAWPLEEFPGDEAAQTTAQMLAAAAFAEAQFDKYETLLMADWDARWENNEDYKFSDVKYNADYLAPILLRGPARAAARDSVSATMATIETQDDFMDMLYTLFRNLVPLLRVFLAESNLLIFTDPLISDPTQTGDKTSGPGNFPLENVPPMPGDTTEGVGNALLRAYGYNGYEMGLLPLLLGIGADVPGFIDELAPYEDKDDEGIANFRGANGKDQLEMIFGPIMFLFSALVRNPFQTLLQVLPNVARFLSDDVDVQVPGEKSLLGQSVDRLLQPVLVIIEQLGIEDPGDMAEVTEPKKTDAKYNVGDVFNEALFKVDMKAYDQYQLYLQRKGIYDGLTMVLDTLNFKAGEAINEMLEGFLPGLTLEEMIIGTPGSPLAFSDMPLSHHPTVNRDLNDLGKDKGANYVEVDMPALLTKILVVTGAFEKIPNFEALVNLLNVWDRDLYLPPGPQLIDYDKAPDPTTVPPLFWLTTDQSNFLLQNLNGVINWAWRELIYNNDEAKDEIEALLEDLLGTAIGLADTMELTMENLFGDFLYTERNLDNLVSAVMSLKGQIDSIEFFGLTLQQILDKTLLVGGESIVLDDLFSFFEAYSPGDYTIGTVDPAGDFVDALAAMAAPLMPLLGVFLTEDNLLFINDDTVNDGDGFLIIDGYDGYRTGLLPILMALGADLPGYVTGSGDYEGLVPYAEFKAANGEDQLKAIINPLLYLLERLAAEPVNTLLQMVPNLAYFFGGDDDSALIQQAINNLLHPLSALLGLVSSASSTIPDLTNLGIPTLINGLLDGVIPGLTLDMLVVGVIELFVNPFNTVGVNKRCTDACDPVCLDHHDKASYVITDLKLLLIQLLTVSHLLDDFDDDTLEGLANLLNVGNIGPGRARPIDYAMAPPPIPVAQLPWLTDVQAQFLVDNADGVLKWAWNELVYKSDAKGELETLLGDLLNTTVTLQPTIEDSVRDLMDTQLYTSGNLDLLADFLLGIYDAIDGIPPIYGLTVKEILAAAIKIDVGGPDLVDFDFDVLFDNVLNYTSAPITGGEGEFKTKLAALLAPFAPLLRIFLAEGDLMFIVDHDVNNPDCSCAEHLCTSECEDPCDYICPARGNGLLKIFGTNGYKTGLLPILMGIGATVPGFLDGMIDGAPVPGDYEGLLLYNEFKALPDDELVLAFLDPILYLLDALIKNPVATLLQVVPNVAYFISDLNAPESMIQQAIDRILLPVAPVFPVIPLLSSAFDPDFLNDLGLGTMINEILDGILSGLTLEQLVVGTKTIFAVPYNTMGVDGCVRVDPAECTVEDCAPATCKHYIPDCEALTCEHINLASYVDVNTARLLAQILTITGALDGIDDDLLAGLAALLNVDNIGPDKTRPIDYAKAPPAADVDALSWLTEPQAQFLLNNVDGVIKWLWKEFIYGTPDLRTEIETLLSDLLNTTITLEPTLEATVKKLLNDHLYTTGNLDMIANMLQGFYDMIDGIDPIYGLTIKEVLAEAIKIDMGEAGLVPLDIDELFDNILNYVPGQPVADETDFMTKLAGLLTPFVPLLRVFLAEGDLMFIVDPEVNDNNGLIKIFGSNGYESGLLPILMGIGAIVPGFLDKLTLYKDFKGLEDDEMVLALLDPILHLLDMLIKNPVATVIQVIPNVAYFISDINAPDSMLQQAVNKLLLPLAPILPLVPALAELFGSDSLDLSIISDLGVGTMINDMLSGVMDGLTLEKLVVGTIELFESLDLRALGVNGDCIVDDEDCDAEKCDHYVKASYVDVSMALLLAQILTVTGALDGISDDLLAGLAGLLNVDNIAPDKTRPIDYAKAPPTVTVDIILEQFRVEYVATARTTFIANMKQAFIDDEVKAWMAAHDKEAGPYANDVAQYYDELAQARAAAAAKYGAASYDAVYEAAWNSSKEKRTAEKWQLDWKSLEPHMQFLLDNLDAVLKIAWSKLIYGQPLQGVVENYLYDLIGMRIELKPTLEQTINDLFGGFLFTTDNLDLLAGVLMGLTDTVDTIGLPYGLTLKDVLKKSISIDLGAPEGPVPLDLDEMFANITGYIPGLVDDNDPEAFKEALAALLTPIAPLLRVFLAEGDLMFVVDEEVNDNNGLIKIFGNNGYESGFLPILMALNPTDQAYLDKLVRYEDFKKLDDTGMLLAIIDPILYLLEKLVKSPVTTALQVLPNVAYFIGQNPTNGPSLLAQAVAKLLIPLEPLLPLVPPLAEMLNTSLDLSILDNLGDMLTIDFDLGGIALSDLVMGEIKLFDDLALRAVGVNGDCEAGNPACEAGTCAHYVKASYVKPDPVTIVLQVLKIAGLLESLKDWDEINLLNLAKLILPEPRAMEKIDYTVAPPAVPVEYPPWLQEVHTQFLVDNADIVIDWAWSELGVQSMLQELLDKNGIQIDLADTLAKSVELLWSNEPYVTTNLVSVVNTILGLLDSLDEALVGATFPLYYDLKDDNSLTPMYTKDLSEFISIYDESTQTLLPLDIEAMMKPMTDLYEASATYQAMTTPAAIAAVAAAMVAGEEKKFYDEKEKTKRDELYNSLVAQWWSTIKPSGYPPAPTAPTGRGVSYQTYAAQYRAYEAAMAAWNAPAAEWASEQLQILLPPAIAAAKPEWDKEWAKKLPELEAKAGWLAPIKARKAARNSYEVIGTDEKGEEIRKMLAEQEVATYLSGVIKSNDLITELTPLLGPLMPLLRVFLAECNALVITDPAIEPTSDYDPNVPDMPGTDALGNALLRINGYNGYEMGLVPILAGIGADVPGFVDSIAKYADFKAADDATQLAMIFNPIFGLLDALAASPVKTLLQMLPNVARFISDDVSREGSLLEQALNRLLQPIVLVVETLELNPLEKVEKPVEPKTADYPTDYPGNPYYGIPNGFEFSLEKRRYDLELARFERYEKLQNIYDGFMTVTNFIDNLKLGNKINKSIEEAFSDNNDFTAFRIEDLIIGDVMKFSAMPNLPHLHPTAQAWIDTVGKYNGANYVETHMADLLAQILKITGVLKLLQEKNLTGLIDLLNHKNRAKGTLPPIIYPWLDTQAISNSLYKGCWWSQKDAICMSKRLEQFIEDVWQIITGKKVGAVPLIAGGASVASGYLRDLLGDALYTQKNFDQIIKLLKDVIDGIDLDMLIIPGSTLTLRKLLEDAVIVMMGDEELDLLGILEEIQAWNKTIVIPEKGDQTIFINGLIDFLKPILPLLDFVLFDKDINILSGKGIINHSMYDDGFITAFGYNGYLYGLIPIYEALLKPMNAPASIIKDKSDIMAMDGEAKLRALLDPLLYAVEQLVTNPLDNLLKILPNVAYFVLPNSLGNDLLQEALDRVMYSLDTVVAELAGTNGHLLPTFSVTALVDEQLVKIGIPGIDSSLLGKLRIGTLTDYASRSGAGITTYIGRYLAVLTEKDRADLLTVILKTVVEVVQNDKNREQIVTLISDAIGVSGFGGTLIHWGIHLILWWHRLWGTNFSLHRIFNLMKFISFFMPIIMWLRKLLAGIFGF